MANIKFSQFTTNAGIDGNPPVAVGSGNSFLVGFDTTANSNNRWSFPQIAAGLSAHIPTIYTGDSNVTSNRTIGLLSSNYLKIQDSSNVDLLSISENGAFALGKGATSSSSFNTVVGGNASGSSVGNTNIGYNTSSGGNYQTAIGYGSQTSGNFAVAIGSYNTISTGNNSITLNATTGTGSTINSGVRTFAVYMSSKATPDFKVVGGGESVLNTSLQITGQGYSSIQTGVVISSNIDFNQGNVQEVTLVASTTTDFDPINFKAGATYILKLIQPTGGNGLVDWEAAGATVNWPGGTPPTLSTAAGAVDIVTLICTDQSSGQGTYYANATLNFS